MNELYDRKWFAENKIASKSKMDRMKAAGFLPDGEKIKIGSGSGQPRVHYTEMQVRQAIAAYDSRQKKKPVGITVKKEKLETNWASNGHFHKPLNVKVDGLDNVPSTYDGGIDPQKSGSFIRAMARRSGSNCVAMEMEK